jgi:hypothetical protein
MPKTPKPTTNNENLGSLEDRKHTSEHNSIKNEMEALRGVTSKPELLKVLPELLLEQAKDAYDAYAEMAGKLGAELVSEEQFAELLTAKEAEWLENDVYGYIADQFMETGGLPNLVASPNVAADWKQIQELAEPFSAGQRLEPFRRDDLLRKYSAKELSGSPKGEAGVRLSIIMSSDTERLDLESSDAQRAELRRMQGENPGLSFHAPNALEAFAYHLKKVKEGEPGLGGSSNTIRLFGLPDKSYGTFGMKRKVVPEVSGYSDGNFYVRDGDANQKWPARVAFG